MRRNISPQSFHGKHPWVRTQGGTTGKVVEVQGRYGARRWLLDVPGKGRVWAHGRMEVVPPPPGQNPCENPAFSAYFVGRGWKVSERYFRGRTLKDALSQTQRYAKRHGLKVSTLWRLSKITNTGQQFKREWARRLNPHTQGGEHMALWLDNPKHRRHRRRHAHNVHHRHRRHSYNRHRRHHRRNPMDGAIVSPERALQRPMPFLTQAAFGLGGAYGVVTFGNYVQANFLPGYTGNDWTSRIVRAAVRGGVGYGTDYLLARYIHGPNRSALRIGMAIGVGGSLVLEALGASFVVGQGDTAQMPGDILKSAGLVAGSGAYSHVALPGIRGAGAYVRRPVLAGTASGMGEYDGLSGLAMGGMYDAGGWKAR